MTEDETLMESLQLYDNIDRPQINVIIDCVFLYARYRPHTNFKYYGIPN